MSGGCFQGLVTACRRPGLHLALPAPTPHCPVRGLEFYKESMSSGEALSNYYAAIEQIEEVRVGGPRLRAAAQFLHFVSTA